MMFMRATNVNAVTTSIDLEVNCNCWIAHSPYSITLAGTMPYASVPFCIPSWVSAGRVDGWLLGKGKGGGDFGGSAALRAAQAMPGNTPLERSLSVAASSQAPRSAMKTMAAVAAHPAVQGHSSNSSIWSDVGNFFTNTVVPGIGQWLAKEAGPLLRAAAAAAPALLL